MADDTFDDSNFQDEPPKKQGMSTGLKVVLILLGVGGLAMLVCCGVGLWMASQVGNAMTTDPARIAEIRGSIVEIDLPEGYSGQVGMDMNLGVFSMQMAAFTDGAGGFLNLMQMQMPNADQAEIERQMKQQASNQGQGQPAEEFNIESSETKQIEVKGAPVDFTFAKGKMDDGTEARMISGVFPGKSGTAMLQMIIREDAYDEDQITQMIESIK